MNPFLWQFEPDWSDGVTETLEFKTDILQSYSGAEQRIARRLSPRRTFEFSILVASNERQRFENRLSFAGAKTWFLPVFNDVQIVDTAITKGTQTLSIHTAGYDFVPGGSLLLKSGFGAHVQSAVLTVKSIANDVVVLTYPLESDFPAGAFCYPLRLAMLTDMPELKRHHDALLSAQIRFKVTEHNAHQDAINLPIYRGFPVLTIPPDWSEPLTGRYERLLLELDNNSGLAYRIDIAQRPFFLQSFAWQSVGREAQSNLRSLFYYLRGRQRCLWVASQGNDLTPVSDIQNNFIDVTSSDLSMIGITLGRKDIVILTTSGEQIYRRIKAIAALSEDKERLLLDGDALTLAQQDILSISFLVLSRLDTDSISFEHETDSDGLVNVNVNFKGVRDELETI